MERKGIYVAIFVITTIIASCLSVYFAIKGNNDKVLLEQQIKELNLKISNLEKSNELNKNEKEDISSTEKEEGVYTKLIEIRYTPDSDMYNFENNTWKTNIDKKYYIAVDGKDYMYIIDEQDKVIKKFNEILSRSTVTSAFCIKSSNVLTIIQYDSTAYDINLENYECKKYTYASGGMVQD